jgi:PIN domain nuclease of toxin-antitoxin system
VWELSIHAAQQRIIFDAPFAATLTTALYSYSIDLLPVTLKDTARNAELPFLTMNGSEHRDPFDRLIIAQGLLRGLPIVTKDRKFASYGIEVIW